MAAALERFGRLDAFFANAGFGAKRGFLEETREHWRAMVDTNVSAPRCRSAPRSPTSRSRTAATSCSPARSPAGAALPGSLYSATKWAVHAHGRGLRQEVADTKIKVTLIEPGMVDTPFFDNPVSGALEPDDIARAVLYALSQPAHVDVNEVLMRPINQPT